MMSRTTPHFSFPDELWRRVLEEATFVPGELDTTNDAFKYVSMINAVRQTEKAIRASYKLRRSIVLVSRLWNEFGTPILYQSIVISNIGSSLLFGGSVASKYATGFIDTICIPLV